MKLLSSLLILSLNHLNMTFADAKSKQTVKTLQLFVSSLLLQSLAYFPSPVIHEAKRIRDRGIRLRRKKKS
jgi:hypothetical protein